MNMWGGENIEQSIRIWLCGGEIFVASASAAAREALERSLGYERDVCSGLMKSAGQGVMNEGTKDPNFSSIMKSKSLQSQLSEVCSQIIRNYKRSALHPMPL